MTRQDLLKRIRYSLEIDPQYAHIYKPEKKELTLQEKLDNLNKLKDHMLSTLPNQLHVSHEDVVNSTAKYIDKFDMAKDFHDYAENFIPSGPDYPRRGSSTKDIISYVKRKIPIYSDRKMIVQLANFFNSKGMADDMIHGLSHQVRHDKENTYRSGR